ncbi:porin [Marivivens donghaensis]|uniref:Porin n=1 Tax=Marivivens donghaensis TaxID=1699413 RepID=A0ABX0VU71_9RHOB|nr:porin [Marivivens donghaensis]NIY71594.1 porin [Marivivens donghaensis]
MKKILLASASIVAFAGVAAAEVNYTGSATLGYNDEVNAAAGGDDNDGFYWDANVAVTLSQELDNGLTAAASFDYDVADNNTGQDLTSGGYVLSLTSDMAGLYYGDTGTAADSLWVSAGDMESDGFTSDAFDGANDAVLRGDMTFGDVDVSVSYTIASATQDLDQLSVAAKAALGQFTVVAAYEEAADVAEAGDFNDDEIMGLSVSTSMAGADFVLAYAEDENSDSTGLKVTYPVGPVKLTAYYVSESVGDDNYGVKAAYANGPVSLTVDYQDDQGVAKTSIDGSYDLANGLMVYAGAYMEDNQDDEYYVAGQYDLGGDATLLVSYADAGTTGNADDEVGAGDYQLGTTVEVSFSF